MKHKIWLGISLCLTITGLVLCFYCMLSENESLVAEFMNIDARNKMNQAISQEWNPEVVRAVNSLEQIVKEYKSSEEGKRKSFNLFPNILN